MLRGNIFLYFNYCSYETIRVEIVGLIKNKITSPVIPGHSSDPVMCVSTWLMHVLHSYFSILS